MKLISNQTIFDFDVFPNIKSSGCIFDIYNNTITKGGKERLKEIFQSPLSSYEEIKIRQNLILSFKANSFKLQFDKQLFEYINQYYNFKESQNGKKTNNILNGMSFLLNKNQDYYIIKNGVKCIIKLLVSSAIFVESVDMQLIYNHFLCNKHLQNALKAYNLKKLTDIEINPFLLSKFDFLFNKQLKPFIIELIQHFYYYDAISGIAKSERLAEYTMPNIDQNAKNLHGTGIYHPLISKPVCNSFAPDNNITIITGPNMAGKSTIIKAIGLHVYIAHLGLPVPAKYFSCPVYNNIITAIYTTDIIDKGMSSFYSEIINIKSILELIKKGETIFAVFDELFKGTNVKDAHDCTVEAIKILSESTSGTYIISTHLSEAAIELSSFNNISFYRFSANITSETIQYTYQMKKGISDQKIGLVLFRKEYLKIINK